MIAGTDALAAPPALDELVRSNQALLSRVRELEAANVSLRREVQLQARRLLLGAEQPGQQPCTQHGEHECAHCRVHDGATGPAQPLSSREREVLRLLTEGSRTPCIAARLGISGATVEVHRRNIMRKVGLHTVAALTKYALREGLTSL